MALVTAGHTTGLRGRKLYLKNQTWLLIQVAQVRLTARRYVLEDICKKLFHLFLIDRRESKPKGSGQREPPSIPALSPPHSPPGLTEM